MYWLFFFLLAPAVMNANPGDTTSLTGCVNPFIGTANGGNTFPGAVLPWGMISLSPRNTPGAPSGYIHDARFLYGIGHNHLSGTGCADLGNIIVTAVRESDHVDPEQYRSEYGREIASPGYYSVFLKNTAVTIENTVSLRSGMVRFTPESDAPLRVLVDASRNLNDQLGGAISVVNESEIEGHSVTGGFCGEENRKNIYFVIRASRAFQKARLWGREGEILSDYPGPAESAVLEFDRFDSERLIIKTGISYVSIENARQNLDMELHDRDFDDLKTEARAIWEDALSRVTIESEDQSNLVKFYTAVYHSLIHPNVISDAGGAYPIYQAEKVGTIDKYPRYSVFSLWDTYRTLHPFLTLVYPEKQLEMVSTMVDMAREWGWLPKWELVSNETYMMVGDPASIVIADTYLKGTRDFDIETAYKSMTRTIEEAGTPEALPSRPGYHELLEYGYIPFEQDWSTDWWVWGPVSTMLEYNYADRAIASLAKELGYASDAARYFQYSGTYRNIFNRETQLIQPRLKNGEWLAPFDPLETEGSGDWGGSGGPGYVEGNAWNYTWFVNHDVPGLIELFGGEENFKEKLVECFDREYFTITNEPDMAYPYLFTWLKDGETITRKIVHELIGDEFSTEAAGLPGNDDAGALSTWLVFSMLGMYPVDPVSGMYMLTVPVIDRAVITLDPEYHTGRTFEIVVEHESGSSDSPATFNLNGIKLEEPVITHEQIISGGTLRITY